MSKNNTSLAVRKSAERTKRRMKTMLSFMFKVCLGIVMIFPIIIMISWSIRSDVELVKYGASLIPHDPTFRFYTWCFENLNLGRYIANSFIQFFIVFIGHVVTASLTAYALVFFKFKGAGLVFGMILAAQSIPGDVNVVANYITIQRLSLTDTYLGLTITSIVGGMAIFMMRQFYLTVPRELKEASEIDGCGDIRFLMRILMPISVPTYASLCIYDFIGVYNSWLWPLMVTNKDEMRTVQIGLARALNGDVYDEYALVLAASTVAIIPTIIVFVIAQEYLIRGMVSGSVKG